MADLEFLIRSRGYLRTQVTKLYDKISNPQVTYTSIDKLGFLAKLDGYELDLKKFNTEISSLLWKKNKKDEDLNAEFESCESYTQKIIDSRTAINYQLNERESIQNNQDDHIANSNYRFGKLKLPDVPLPEYSHSKGETLQEFIQAFEGIINKYQLSSYEKYVYLKRQLRKEPLTLIASLSPSNQSYEAAVALLEEAFASSVSQKYEVVRRLSELKLTYSGNPYEFVSEMRVICDLFKTLKIDTEVILQYFIWNSMTSNLQSQLVNICNTNKPTLVQIKDNIFKALDRYLEVSDRIKANKLKFKNKDEVQSFASNIDTNKSSSKSVFCSLCSERNGLKVATHSTGTCSVYSTPEAKRERLELIGACVKCGYANHTTENCRFKFFRPCGNCHGEHMTFLCIKIKSEKINHEKFINDKKSNIKKFNFKKSDKKPNENSDVASGVVWTEAALQSDVGGNAILPTFTFKLGDQIIRGMKDSGCQPNFINESLAVKLKLPIVSDDLIIKVNGFNESREYKTKMVQLDLYLGNKLRTITAICVPEIRTELQLNGLREIINSFISKGYVLADESLRFCQDRISDIKFILGTNDADVLVEQQITFGYPVPSLYSVTDAGVLLYGCLDRIKSNINKLPYSKQFVHAYTCEVIQSTSAFDCPSIESNKLNLNESCQANMVVLNNNGEVDDKLLAKATNNILESQCSNSLKYDTEIYNEKTIEVNNELIKFVLNNTSRNQEGRLVIPLLWKHDISQFLGTNYKLSKQILNSNFKKYKNDRAKLLLIDEVFKEQERTGVIEKIPDINAFVAEHPNHSFLAHMGVFKMERATTKTRIVFLSNLCEGNQMKPASLSHNQALHAGPCLNPKISTAIMHLRFGQKLMVFDLEKAFLQIEIPESDSNKLMFLWYRNVAKEDYTLIAYRNLRLSFGLRCSPTLLMMGLYIILCLNSKDDCPKLKRLKTVLYALMYMDNGAYAGSIEEVQFAYKNLRSIFEPYKFNVQQIATNLDEIQNREDENANEITPESVKLLGMIWNRQTDTLSASPINLKREADSKRTILASIASQYDIFNLQGPCMNRARLFMHSLQCDKNLSWDAKLKPELCKEWQNICRQANDKPPIEIKRFVGDRNDSYKLLAFTDASKSIYGAVTYIKNTRTNEVSFLCARNRLVNAQLVMKTIPTLELQAVTLGVETLSKLREELMGSDCVIPINIVELQLFTDSTITLHWINSHYHKHDKMQKRSVFVMNRLAYIGEQCQIFPIKFSFVATGSNPADCMTRCLSHRQLTRSCYMTAPQFVSARVHATDFDVVVPDPLIDALPNSTRNFPLNNFGTAVSNIDKSSLYQDKVFSSLKKTVNVRTMVIKFINRIKARLKEKYPEKYAHFVCVKSENIREVAFKSIVLQDQLENYSEIFEYFDLKNKTISDMPDLITRFNIFRDCDGLLKIKSKFDRWKENKNFCFPILLCKGTHLTELIIRDTHERFAHAGCYSILSQLCKQFWVPHFFTIVKMVIKKCVTCRRFNSRTVKLNQSSYRSFRAFPPAEPYKYIFVDHLGPYRVRIGDKTQKLWLLCITDLWSRAVNLKICHNLSLSAFLIAFQLHVYEEGLPTKVFSDAGSQIVAGSNIISDFLKSVEIKNYLQENGVDAVDFQQYAKGNSELGSLVEVCVKFIKRLIYGAVKNSVLPYSEFELIVAQTVNLINKRPVAYKEGLRDGNSLEVPAVITPEVLLKGRDMLNLNIIPALQPYCEDNPEWLPNLCSKDSLRTHFAKSRDARSRLIKQYNEEFQKNLLIQATDERGRYKPILHHKLHIGDVVLLKENFMKFNNFPMGVIVSLNKNHLGEVTDIKVRKGNNREIVTRHTNSIIPLLRIDASDDALQQEGNPDCDPKSNLDQRPALKRMAARVSGLKTRELFKCNSA